MRRLKAAQRREQLMETATKIFAKWGYVAATTAAIAKAAGVSEPILYRHFSGKQDLFVAITRAACRETIRRWEELTAGASSATEKIRAIARELPNHVGGSADAYQVIHGALASSRDRKVLGLLREHYRRIEQFLRALIEEGQDAGEFRRDVKASVPAWQIINLGIGYAMIAMNFQKFDHFSAEDSIEFILQGLTEESGRRRK